MQLYLILGLLLALTTQLAEGKGRASGSTSRTRKTGSKKTSPPHSRTGSGRAKSGPSDGKYHAGPKGGCYWVDSSGKKRYVDHSNCQ